MRFAALLTLPMLVSACSDAPDPPTALPEQVHALALADMHALLIDDAQSGAQDAGTVSEDGESIPRAPAQTGSDGTTTTDTTLNLPIATAGAVGAHHACVLSRGDVWCWGDNTGGAVGAHRACGAGGSTTSEDGSTTSCAVDPDLMPTLPEIAQLAAGDDVTCALAAADGKVFCWGTATEGRLGGSFVSALGTPEPVRLAVPATAIYVQHATACAIDTAQRAWCWGEGFGETPTLLDDGRGPLTGVVSVAVGRHHACVVAADGLECWGENLNGQCSDARAAQACGIDAASCPVGPTRIDVDARKVVVGERHSCALTTDGSVVCWGSNEVGQLGRADAFLVGEVGVAATGAIDVAASYAKACAVTEDHEALCWGAYKQ